MEKQASFADAKGAEQCDLDVATFILSAVTRLVIDKDGCTFAKKSFKTHNLRTVKLTFVELFLIILSPIVELKRRFTLSVTDLEALPWIYVTPHVSVRGTMFLDMKFACIRLSGRKGSREQFLNLSVKEFDVLFGNSSKVAKAIGTFYEHDSAIEQSLYHTPLLEIADSILLYLMGNLMHGVKMDKCPGCTGSDMSQCAHFGYCIYFSEADEQHARSKLFNDVFAKVDKCTFGALMCEFIWKYGLVTPLDIFELYDIGGTRRTVLKQKFINNVDGKYLHEVTDILTKWSVTQLIEARKSE
jgi:hypothetical protein